MPVPPGLPPAAYHCREGLAPMPHEASELWHPEGRGSHPFTTALGRRFAIQRLRAAAPRRLHPRVVGRQLARLARAALRRMAN